MFVHDDLFMLSVSIWVSVIKISSHFKNIYFKICDACFLSSIKKYNSSIFSISSILLI